MMMRTRSVFVVGCAALLPPLWLAAVAVKAEQLDSAAVANALADPAAAKQARPTPGQIAWADMEQEMFVHFGVATWKGQEYDSDGRFDLSKMNPKDFDAGQLCATAKSFGARQIILVCKHVGGFCWWPTETTDYCVRSIPWKNGKGNLVKEVADACRRNGLKMGIYIYSDDVRYAGGIGRGGRTDDPKKQEEWNAKLRQQWSEVLTICGPDLVHEVWFDGGCVVPLKDLIEKLAPQAQFFAGPHETIRWPSTESGKLPYPCWSSIAANVYSAGGGGAAATGDPDGPKWCPPECDTVLYGRGGHNWFWSPWNESRRRTLAELMDVYLKSVGRGGVLLLNSSPNTDGRIPVDDMKAYAAFGAEIQRRFGRPLAQSNGVGDALELDLRGAKKVNQAWIMEDLRGGHRIRGYELEGRDAAGKWQLLAEGSSVGHKRIEVFPEATVDKLRLRITKNVGTPILRDFAAFYAEGIDIETEFRALTEGRPTTASSMHSAPYAPSLATDGDSRSRWSAADKDINAWLEVDLGRPRNFGKVVISQLADRIREFVIEYRSDVNSPWRVAFTGGPVGDNYVHEFPSVTGRYVRLRVVQGGSLGPTLWNFELWPGKSAGSPCGRWDKGATTVKLDLTPHIKMPATYEVTVGPARISSARLLFNGAEMPPEDCVVKDGKVIVRQTQQVTAQTKTELAIEFEPTAAAGDARVRVLSEQ